MLQTVSEFFMRPFWEVGELSNGGPPFPMYPEPQRGCLNLPMLKTTSSIAGALNLEFHLSNVNHPLSNLVDMVS